MLEKIKIKNVCFTVHLIRQVWILKWTCKIAVLPLYKMFHQLFHEISCQIKACLHTHLLMTSGWDLSSQNLWPTGNQSLNVGVGIILFSIVYNKSTAYKLVHSFYEKHNLMEKYGKFKSMIGNFGFIKMDKNAIYSETNMILRALVKTNQKYKIIGGLKKLNILYNFLLQHYKVQNCVSSGQSVTFRSSFRANEFAGQSSPNLNFLELKNLSAFKCIWMKESETTSVMVPLPEQIIKSMPWLFIYCQQLHFRLTLPSRYTVNSLWFCGRFCWLQASLVHFLLSSFITLGDGCLIKIIMHFQRATSAVLH